MGVVPSEVRRRTSAIDAEETGAARPVRRIDEYTRSAVVRAARKANVFNTERWTPNLSRRTARASLLALDYGQAGISTIFGFANPESTSQKNLRRGDFRGRETSTHKHPAARIRPRAHPPYEMGKGGNASAAGPKGLPKGLKPDRQYTQIRGQVRHLSTRAPTGPVANGSRSPIVPPSVRTDPKRRSRRV